MNEFLKEREKNIKELEHLNIKADYLNNKINDLMTLKDKVNNVIMMRSNLTNSNLIFLLGTGYNYDIIPIDYYYAYDLGIILPLERRKVEWDYVNVSAIFNIFSNDEMDLSSAKKKSFIIDALVQEVVETHNFGDWIALKEHLKVVSEAIKVRTDKALRK